MRNLYPGLLLMFVAVTAIAQEKNDSIPVFSKHLSIEDLMNIDVVTASGRSEKAADAPSIIHVIHSEELQNYAVTSLIDALKYIPGIEPHMSPDGIYTISIRGMRKDGLILLLIDGHPFNNFYNGSSVLDLPVDFIEKIELIKGPASALYGTNAIAGVINVITKKNQKDAVVRAGTHGTYSAAVNYSYQKKDSLRISTNLIYSRSDGPNQLVSDDKEYKREWSLTYGDKRGRTNRFHEDLILNSNSQFKRLNVALTALARDRGQWVGPSYILTDGSLVRKRQVLLTVGHEFEIRDVLLIKPLVYANYIGVDNTLQEAPRSYISAISKEEFPDGKIVRENYSGVKLGGELEFEVKASERFTISTRNIYERQLLYEYDLSRNYKIVGDEFKGEFGNYDNVPFEQKGKSRDITAICLNGSYKLNKLGLSGGVRFDSYSDFGHTFNPRFGLTYPLSSSLRMKVLYGSAFRAPTLNELYDNTTIGNDYGVKGNPDLEPETIKTAEVQLDFNVKNVLLRTTGHYSLSKHAISIYDPRGSGGIGKYENIGNIEGYGYTVESILTLNGNIKWFANFSHIFRAFEWNPEIARQVDIVFLDKQSSCNRFIRNIPTIRFNSGLSFHYKQFETFLGFNYGYKRENNHRFYLEHGRVVEIPEYYQLNYSVSWQASKNIKVFVSGNNIGDKYADPDESTNINAFGDKGLIQPDDVHLLGIKINF